MVEPATTSAQDALIEWAVRTVADDIMSILDKVTEYGATDLEAMGVTLVPHSPKLGSEAACQFYLLGKVARATAAYKEGNAPSDDTLKDETVYSLMTRFIREHGYWGLPMAGSSLPRPDDDGKP